MSNVAPYEMAVALLAHWQAKLGSYLETNKGITESGMCGEWKGGTYKVINERRAKAKVSHYEHVLRLGVWDEKRLERDYKRLVKKGETNEPIQKG